MKRYGFEFGKALYKGFGINCGFSDFRNRHFIAITVWSWNLIFWTRKKGVRCEIHT